MAKKFKRKNKRNVYILFIIFLISLIYTYKFLNEYFFLNESYSKILLKEATYQPETYELANPIKLLNYSLNEIAVYEEIDLISEDIYDYVLLSKESSFFTDPNPTIVNEPIVYLYNTHQLENYNASYLAEYNIKPNVLMASYILKERLNDLGINTMVEENDITEVLRVNNWKYNYSYEASKYFILDALEKNKSLKYIIDIHRDSASKSVTSTTINNEKYAKIMFVVGLDYQDYSQNLEFTQKLEEIANNLYPSLSRGISKKTGPGVNGIYNQNLFNKATLIEVGGVDNTIDEVSNTMNAISQILKTYIEANNG